MKNILIGLIAVLTFAGNSFALSYTFSDKDFLEGASWGTLAVTVSSETTLQVSYQAVSSDIIPKYSQVTGFGFNFAFSDFGGSLVNILNPLDNTFSNDDDDLDWITLENLNSIPNPANGDEFSPGITKSDYTFGGTEGKANNLSPPGIKPGMFDVFYLEFSGIDLSLFSDLADFVTLTGIRIQALPKNINNGSLFLAGRPEENPVPEAFPVATVPEPGSLVLLGAGLISLGVLARRRS